MITIPQAIDEAMSYAYMFLPEGKVASYIPELEHGDPEQLGHA